MEDDEKDGGSDGDDMLLVRITQWTWEPTH